jgi:hypothetical protein
MENNCYFCTLDDYNDINRIHQSQHYIHGVEKTPAYYARYPTVIRSILTGLKKDYKIIGYKEPNSDRMTGYGIIWVPVSAKIPFNAFVMGESLQTGSVDQLESTTASLLSIAEELAKIGEEKDVLQFFIALPLKAHLGLMRFSKFFKERNKYLLSRYNFLLFSVVGEDGVLKNSIEELLLKNPLMPRLQKIALVEISMMEKYRLEHFAKDIGFNNPDMSKFVMND